MSILIKIVLEYPQCCRATFCAPHYTTHISAFVIDIANCETNENYEMRYVNFPNLPWYSVLLEQRNETVLLYSEKSYQEVMQRMDEKFRDRASYNFACNNCADAIQFLLDYCFPTEKYCCYRTYQLFCFIPCLLSAGLLTCFPVMPCVNSPRDVFNRAQLLASNYGNPPPKFAVHLARQAAARQPVENETTRSQNPQNQVH